MIELWSGTPGSGKSASVTVYALDFIRRGGVVLANFSLADNWCDVWADHTIIGRFSKSYHKKQVDILKNRWWVFSDLDDVWAFSKQYEQYLSKKMKKQFEGRCLLIIDECQLLFNARNWSKNMGWIEFFSQHRKLGFDILLIAHSVEMVDSQCRNYIEYVVKLRNLYRVKIPFIQIPLSYLFLAKNLFFAKWYYFGVGVLTGECWKNRLLPLKKWQAGLYESMRIFRLGDELKNQSGLYRAYSDPDFTISDQADLPQICKIIHEMRQKLFEKSC